MPKYQCPQCEAILRREMPIASGKKVKCPKCEFIFIAEVMHEAADEPKEVKKKVKAVKKPKPKDDDDDEAVGGTYGMSSEEEEEEGGKEEKARAVNYGSLRDKYEKSTRGPAMAKLVKLSNGLLLIGFITVVFAALGIMAGLWPFIFSEKAPSGPDARDHIFKIVAFLLSGLYGGAICFGASKSHTLESYKWAMAGSILASILGLLYLIFGLLGIVVTLMALTAEPKPPEAMPIEKGLERQRGTVVGAEKQEFSVEGADKKSTFKFQTEADTKYLKKISKPAKAVDLRDGVTVLVGYEKQGNAGGIAKTIIIDPSDGLDDDAYLNMFLMLFYLVIIAWGGFSAKVGIASVKRLRDPDVRDGFEETQETRDY
jgi:hypothetical protein